MSATQWLLLAVCFGIMIADGFDTASMAFVAPALGQQLSIPRPALGPVLSAALFGLATGAFAAGPLADKFGRRRILIAAVLLFSAWSLATAAATTVTALAVCRFLTGLGIGAAMPNCTTLIAEFTPSARRSSLGNLMFVGFPLGASLGGFVAAALIPRHGWQSVFLVGGIAPLSLAALLLGLPESISFMVVRDWPLRTIRSALARLASNDPAALAGIQHATSFRVDTTPLQESQPSLALLLSPFYLRTTLSLWGTYFFGLLLYYTITSWMPTLIRDAGHSIGDAARITALFPLGGIAGALLCGWLMDRLNPTRVVVAAYALTAALLLLLSRSTARLIPFMILTLLAGAAMNGAQTSLPVLGAACYPTRSRASGVSWMLGVGRFGGVLGALAGGALIHIGFHLAGLLVALAAVALLAALALSLPSHQPPSPAMKPSSTP